MALWDYTATVMQLTHHGKQIELDDDWWREAGMGGFVPNSPAYPVDGSAVPDKNILEVPIEDVGPVCRNPGVAIFNDDHETGRTARQRVVEILSGFRSGSAIPPVEVVRQPPGYPYPYKLTHGVHRFYCSLAAGFTHVPAVLGFDWDTLDQ